jgi:hypothetical protein
MRVRGERHERTNLVLWHNLSSVASSTRAGFRVVGGASFPAPIGTVTLSWPLAVAEATADGIEVAMRKTMLRFLMVRFMSDSPGPTGVSRFAWADLAKVSLAPRSMVFRARSGYCCKFSVLRASSLSPLVHELRSHGIPIESVRSSWR